MVVISCLIIFAGFLSVMHIKSNIQGTTLDSLKFESKGFFFGVLSSFTTALHSIVIKQSLEYFLLSQNRIVENNTIDLVYYNNALSAALLSVGLFFSGKLFNSTLGELQRLESSNSYSLGIGIISTVIIFF